MAKNKGMVHGTDAETGRKPAEAPAPTPEVNGQAVTPSAASAPEPKKKKECPVTRKEFLQHAKSIKLTVVPPEGMGLSRDLDLEVKEFSTGSFGFFFNDKIPLHVNGKQVKVQANISLTVVNSKDAAAE